MPDGVRVGGVDLGGHVLLADHLVGGLEHLADDLEVPRGDLAVDLEVDEDHDGLGVATVGVVEPELVLVSLAAAEHVDGVVAHAEPHFLLGVGVFSTK